MKLTPKKSQNLPFLFKSAFVFFFNSGNILILLEWGYTERKDFVNLASHQYL